MHSGRGLRLYHCDVEDTIIVMRNSEVYSAVVYKPSPGALFSCRSVGYSLIMILSSGAMLLLLTGSRSTLSADTPFFPWSPVFVIMYQQLSSIFGHVAVSVWSCHCGLPMSD